MSLPSVNFTTLDDFQTGIEILASHNHFDNIIICQCDMKSRQLIRICEIILSNHVLINHLMLINQKNLFRYGEEGNHFDWHIMHYVRNLFIKNCLVQDNTNFRNELINNKSLRILNIPDTDISDVTSYIVSSNICELHIGFGTVGYLCDTKHNSKLRVLGIPILSYHNGTFAQYTHRQCITLLAFITQNHITQLEFRTNRDSEVSRDELNGVFYNYAQIDDRIRKNAELDSLSRKMCKSAAIHLYGCLRHVNPFVFNKDVTRIISKLVIQTIDESIWRDTYKQKIQKHYY